MRPMLELSQVGFSYHLRDSEVIALSDVSFQVTAGEFVAIVGPSGCGKSTLLSIIAGLIPVSSGSVLVDGLSPERSVNRIGYMLQKDHLLEWRKIYDNMCLGLEIRGLNDPSHQASVRQMMETYGLGKFADHYPASLSGGMRQRVALIRTLALAPDILLLDEPFSALDYLTRLEVGDDIGQIIRKTGKTAILVTHDLSEAISLADRIVVLTNRPGTVKCILDIEFPDGITSSLERRNSPEFSKHFNRVWTALKSETLTKYTPEDVKYEATNKINKNQTPPENNGLKELSSGEGGILHEK